MSVDALKSLISADATKYFKNFSKKFLVKSLSSTLNDWRNSILKLLIAVSMI